MGVPDRGPFGGRSGAPVAVGVVRQRIAGRRRRAGRHHPLGFVPVRHRPVRRRVLRDLPERGRQHGPPAAHAAGGHPRGARTCRDPPRGIAAHPDGRVHRSLPQRVRRHGVDGPRPGGRLFGNRRCAEHHLQPGVLLLRSAWPVGHRRHRLLVVVGGHPPGLPEPAHRRLGSRSGRRRQRAALTGRHPEFRPGRGDVAHRPVSLLRRPRGRIRARRGLRRRRPQAPRRRRTRRRPDPGRRPRLRGQPGRPVQRSDGAQSRCPDGRAARGVLGSRGRTPRDRLRRGARHGHPAG